jgi:hypothetical protein
MNSFKTSTIVETLAVAVCFEWLMFFSILKSSLTVGQLGKSWIEPSCAAKMYPLKVSNSGS